MSEETQSHQISEENLKNDEFTIEILPNLENDMNKISVSNLVKDEVNEVKQDVVKDTEHSLDTFNLEEKETLQNKINLLENDIKNLILKLDKSEELLKSVESLLHDKTSHNNVLQEDLKNKEMLLNNKTEKINELSLELEDIRHKNKQQNMVSLLTKLKTNDIKIPIVVEEPIEAEQNNTIKYPNNTKALLIKRRKKVF